MDWLRRLFGGKSKFELMLDHIERMRDKDRALELAQQQTLDRIVAARYDRPTYAAPEPGSGPTPPTLEEMVDVNTEDAEWLQNNG